MSEPANFLPDPETWGKKHPRLRLSDISARTRSTRPALSLVLCSRNDRYQGNSLWRLQTTLNYTAQQVHDLAIEDDVEIIVSDWGSDIPLRDITPLTPDAARLVKFVTVPPAIATIGEKGSQFREVLALNTAVRRASGEYVGRIDQDTLVGRRFFETFFWLREKRRLLVSLESVIMISNRRSIPYRFATRCPPLWTVERYVEIFGRLLPLKNSPPPHLFYVVYIGILLMHRDIWFDSTGYDERLLGMDFMELDMIYRLASRYQVLDLGELTDRPFYHLDHEHPRVPRHLSRYEREGNPPPSLDAMPDEARPSGESWGLHDRELESSPSRFKGHELDDRERAPAARWMTFVFVSVLSSVQIFGDIVSRYLRRLLRKQRLARYLYFHLSRGRIKRRAVLQEGDNQ